MHERLQQHQHPHHQQHHHHSETKDSFWNRLRSSYRILFLVALLLATSVHAFIFERSNTGMQLSVPTVQLTPGTRNVHVILLIHGIYGSPDEMKYVHQALLQQIFSVMAETDNEEKAVKTKFLVHSVESNYERTTDGIDEGAKRLGAEANRVVQKIAAQQEANTGEPIKISLSLLGNSLGGLYARAALPYIEWHSTIPNVGDLEVIPAVFCTTCTPHLGTSGTTYLTVPRFVEQVIAFAFQKTGMDLFRQTDFMKRLAYDPKYVEPLQSFSKRIAYANAFGTDFQVPTTTAAFLSDTDSPHSTIPNTPGSPFFLAVETRPDKEILSKNSFLDAESDDHSDDSSTGAMTPSQRREMTNNAMARRLDALGWIKVFGDVRETLVSIPIPFHKSSSCMVEPKKDNWTAAELKEYMADTVVHDNKWAFPAGHTMLVANSKSRMFAEFNKKGRPFMDHLANELVRDILSVEQQQQQQQ